MKKDYKILIKNANQKVNASIQLVEASLSNLMAYEFDKIYTPKELEPYDALSDRFIRAVETCIKFFKTYELYQYAISSETFRDLLLKMEKQKIVTSVEKWIDMRDIRNRIVHDYLPEHIKDIFDLVMTDFSKELLKVKKQINKIVV
jgi:uncharacterized protein with HEPN domain